MLVVVEVYMGSSRSFLGVPLPVAETETSSSCLRNTGIGVAALEADATGSDETAIAGGGGGGGADCCCCRGVSGSGDASRALIFMLGKHKAPTLHGQDRARQSVTRWFALGLTVVLSWLGQLQLAAATATTTMRRSRSMRES